MLLLHGTGSEVASIIIAAGAGRGRLKEHDVVWHSSESNRIYFWGDSGSVIAGEVSIKQEVVVRAGESAMYTKAISGSRDSSVCVLVFELDEKELACILPDPDSDGTLPAFCMSIGDFNRCIKNGTMRLLAAVSGELYHPELRWEYLAAMRGTGRRFSAEGIAEDERFWYAMKDIVFREGVPVAFERLFKNPLLSASWKSIVC